MTPSEKQAWIAKRDRQYREMQDCFRLMRREWKEALALLVEQQASGLRGQVDTPPRTRVSL